MIITSQDIHMFIQCETKAYLVHLNGYAAEHEPDEWSACYVDNRRQEYRQRLLERLKTDRFLEGVSVSEILRNYSYRIAFDCVAKTENYECVLDALIRTEATPSLGPFVPVRFAYSDRISSHDRLLLAFDALVASETLGLTATHGRIMSQSGQSTIRIGDDLLGEVRKIISALEVLTQSPSPPDLVLGKYCVQCAFNDYCRSVAIRTDDLSLMGRMSRNDRSKYRSKGIFTIQQLSYTFRARRRPSRLASRPPKYDHALRALAIRTGKIHIVGKPEFEMDGTPVYLDVEGIPQRKFYYLIGLRVAGHDPGEGWSFWADDEMQQKQIWMSFLHALSSVNHPQIVHYGSYESIFLRAMTQRYGCPDQATAKVLENPLNILSVIYPHVYFPTYSNGLKDIATSLAFKWTEDGVSGFRALCWRQEWEITRNPRVKERLVQYNSDDCKALALVTSKVQALCKGGCTLDDDNGGEVVAAESLGEEQRLRFGKIDFVLPEMELINQRAYWDYQRRHVSARTERARKRRDSRGASRKVMPAATGRAREKALARPAFCPKCGGSKVYKYGRFQHFAQDLKFTKAGIRRENVKYEFDRYICWECRATFFPPDRPWDRTRFGQGLMAYVTYQLVELRLSQRAISNHIKELFGLDIGLGAIRIIKERSAQVYSQTYDSIQRAIVAGNLVHADETRIRLFGDEGYVWVLASDENVLYFYTDTREAQVIRDLLSDFQGVLVSDFYAGYDAISCRQQKCLIHLIRDLNDDLLHEPFNLELRELAASFTALLQAAMKTVDRYGLQSRFLRKHLAQVEQFYDSLCACRYKSDVALRVSRRFNKERNRLFTFLTCDGVPWNNNNAEHAVKAFARLRRAIGTSSSEKGIKEYLVLLSICETCKYRGMSFLAFLRSGLKNVDAFANPQ